jgi:hypothetical protein
MSAYNKGTSSLKLLDHAGRGCLLAVLCTMLLLGRLILCLSRGVGWLVTRCRSAAADS